MTSKPFTQRTVALSRLHLDPRNPRHDVTEDEPSIIEKLVRDEQILPLAEDICKRGLSPLERLAVIPHPILDSHFVMVEGNRRLCSLKLLRDPKRAPAPNRKAFKRLADHSQHCPDHWELLYFQIETSPISGLLSSMVGNKAVSVLRAGTLLSRAGLRIASALLIGQIHCHWRS